MLILSLAMLPLALAAFPGLENELPRPGARAINQTEQGGRSRNEGPWLATRAFAALETTSWPADQGAAALRGIRSPSGPINGQQLRELLGLNTGYDVTAIVATVADPAHTRLSIVFDRQVEAIERASEAKGWVFSHQWLPWTQQSGSPTLKPEEQRTERQMDQERQTLPGILMFRRGRARDWSAVEPWISERVLVVLLVPETPTAGISGDAFYAALNLAVSLAPTHEIGLLTPSFSGSFQSLAKLTGGWLHAVPEHLAHLHKTVYGGSASSTTAARAFVQALAGGGIQFQSGVMSSHDSLQAIRGIAAKFGFPESRVALLIEGESGFGEEFVYPEIQGQSGRQAAPFPIYRFPRNISHLRDAYQQAEAASQNKAGIPGLEFSLKDSSRGEDSIPIFSELQTPTSQGAVLSLIANELNEKYSLVYVAATNELDSIFLARFLRRQAPNTRVLIGGDTDVLFLAAAQQEALTGTLFLSTYPLFILGNEWLRPTAPQSGQRMDLPTNAHLVMPSETFRGLFNVMQFLLEETAPNSGAHGGETLRGYRRLTTDRTTAEYPGLWLLSLTRSGYLPVDWIDAASGPQSDTLFVKVTQNKPIARTLEERFPLPIPPLEWLILAWVSGVGTLLTCICVAWASATPSDQGAPSRLGPNKDLTLCLPEIIGLLLALAMVNWLVLCPVLGIPRNGLTITLRIAFGISLLIATLALCRSWRHAWSASQRAAGMRRYATPCLGTGYLVAYLVAGFLWDRACWGNGVNDTPGDLMFRLRTLAILSGVSPLSVAYLLNSGVLCGFAITFYRYSKTGFGRPRLPPLRILGTDTFQYSYESANELIEGQLSIRGQRIRWRYGLALCASGATVAFLTGKIHAFEQAPLNELLLLGLTALLLHLACGIFDAVVLWRDLRTMLELLEVTPLREAFERVAQPWPRARVWALGQYVSDEVLAAQAVHALRNRAIAGGDDAAATVLQDAATARFNRNHHDKTAQLESRENYEEKAARQTQLCVTSDLESHWSGGIEAQNDLVAIRDEARAYVRHAADFVALQLASYFIYAARQLQHICLGVSVEMVLIVVVLSSYHPQAPLAVSGLVIAIWAAVSTAVVGVFVGMDRNWIVSTISRTSPGELDAHFWLRMFGLGAVPVVTVLAHLFPSVSNVVYSWIMPSISTLK